MSVTNRDNQYPAICHYWVICFYPFLAFSTYLLHGWFGPGMYFGLPTGFDLSSCCLFSILMRDQSLPSNTATRFPDLVTYMSTTAFGGILATIPSSSIS